jgi:RNA polymerase sigma-70 factor, ECF subfamily
MATGQEGDRAVGGAREETGDIRRRAFVRHLDVALDRSYALAAVILGDRADAEEATHDAVCTAWRGIDGLRDPDRVEAWFTRILVNACRDRLRRRRVRPIAMDLPPDLPATDAGPDLATIDAVTRALADLSPDHRAVVVLRFWADLPIEEIAARTGERAGTVKSRLHYAVAQLRAAWRPDDPDWRSRS